MKPPKLFPIPAGTPASTCTSPRCRATIYRVGRMPLRAESPMRYAGADHVVDGVKHPTATDAGVGYSHFIDCVAAGEFRRDESRP